MLLLLLGALPGDFLPCVEGTVIEYRTGATATTDTVKGSDARKLCRIERTTVRSDGSKETDAYLREILPDRVLSAGWAATPLAQRPPLLMAPIEVGTHWQFNRARYRITEVGACKVGELAFDRCVTVEMIGDDGTTTISRYAAGIGLVEQSFDRATMTAIDVRVPKSETPAKSSRGARR